MVGVHNAQFQGGEVMRRHLEDLVTNLKEAKAIANQLEQEWALIQIRKEYQLTIQEFKKVLSLIEKQQGGDQ